MLEINYDTIKKLNNNINRETLEILGYIQTSLHIQVEYDTDETDRADRYGYKQLDYKYIFVYTNDYNSI